MDCRTLTRARRVGAGALIAVFAILLQTNTAAAQTGGIAGQVLTDAGAPAIGVAVRIDNSPRTAETNAEGLFRFDDVPAGTVMLIVEQIGWKPVHRAIDVPSGAIARVTVRLEARALLLDEVVVTTSREEQRRAETPASVHAVSGADIERLKPSHPSEVMNRMPGVWVNVTGGEGHMAAIRHPMTTNPVYLYMENGVPTRSTGFFNHNAMYEVDVPHAARVEVVKGPATALYGSDAIGGMVNVLTRAPEDVGPFSASLEAGAHGFGRVLASTSAGAVLGEANLTRTRGWRDGTEYNRQSATLRWDRDAGASTLRTSLTYSRIDQSTAGTSALPEELYRTAPRTNLTPISYRDVQAVRASAAWERVRGGTLLSVTPFARWNSMEMLPNWSLTYDPAISSVGHASAGALLKVRHEFAPLRLRALGGVDIDYSPGTRTEWQVNAERVGGVFTDFTRGDVIYDYDVAFHSVSPWLQLEAQPLPNVRIVTGLRYDRIGYDYDNALGALQTGAHRRPESTGVSYDHLSPKAGIVWAPVDEFRVYGSYGHGFRVPSEGQLFRQGRAERTIDLDPVRADNVEVGAAGVLGSLVSYDVAVYHMRKRDDLLTFTHTDGSTETMNAGQTLHRGVEAGLAVALPADLRLDAGFAIARHEYVHWEPRAGEALDGSTMESAPERTGNVGLTWSPRRWQGTSAAIDMQHVGPYWMDAANTTEYDGHTLVTLRAGTAVTDRIALFARLTNALDTRYAELAQFTVARGSEFAPGMPRTLYAGVSIR